jgi:3-methyladenine DNA glycosylase AlkD
VDVNEVAAEIDGELRAAGTPERAVASKAYLKSDLEHYGVSVPELRRIATACSRAHPELDRRALLQLVAALWEGGVHDRRAASVELLVQHLALLEGRDLAFLEGLVRTARTWALVDPMAIDVVGPLVVRDPTASAELDRWAVDAELWVRRSALLALLRPIRAGAGDFERFGAFADQMLDEPEFFIRKAIGWVLRDAGRTRPEMVYEWLLPRAARASGVTLREAVKPLSDAQRAEVLSRR